MIESTFQLAPGLGPVRERQMWRAGVTRWRDLPSASVKLTDTVDRALRTAIDAAGAALAAGDVDGVAELVPTREQWRLFAQFGDGAAYLDIETRDRKSVV